MRILSEWTEVMNPFSQEGAKLITAVAKNRRPFRLGRHIDGAAPAFFGLQAAEELVVAAGRVHVVQQCRRNPAAAFHLKYRADGSVVAAG